MRPEDIEMIANIYSFERMEVPINEFQSFKAPGKPVNAHTNKFSFTRMCFENSEVT